MWDLNLTYDRNCNYLIKLSDKSFYPWLSGVVISACSYGWGLQAFLRRWPARKSLA
jgi:hypothetical protein